MKALDGVLPLLNESLTIELTAVNQYFLAAEQCAAWGFPGLQGLFRDLSFEEMKDCQTLVRHILYLDGLPNLQRLNRVAAGEAVPELFETGLAQEHAAVDQLRAGIVHCAQVGDFNSRQLLEHMLHGEEEHVDLFETKLSAIASVGLERFLAQYITDK
jgi:bacterioferritin